MDFADASKWQPLNLSLTISKNKVASLFTLLWVDAASRESLCVVWRDDLHVLNYSSVSNTSLKSPLEKAAATTKFRLLLKSRGA